MITESSRVPNTCFTGRAAVAHCSQRHRAKRNQSLGRVPQHGDRTLPLRELLDPFGQLSRGLRKAQHVRWGYVPDASYACLLRATEDVVCPRTCPARSGCTHPPTTEPKPGLTDACR